MSHRPTRRHAAAAITAVAALTLTACAGPTVGSAGTDDATTTADAVDWSQVEPASEITWWPLGLGASRAPTRSTMCGGRRMPPLAIAA